MKVLYEREVDGSRSRVYIDIIETVLKERKVRYVDNFIIMTIVPIII